MHSPTDNRYIVLLEDNANLKSIHKAIRELGASEINVLDKLKTITLVYNGDPSDIGRLAGVMAIERDQPMELM